MDDTGLLHAGAGLDQVTWMDVRIGDHLPTPRHGCPVELNAYWYNALRILARLAPAAGADGAPYDALADRVGRRFPPGLLDAGGAPPAGRGGGCPLPCRDPAAPQPDLGGVDALYPADPRHGLAAWRTACAARCGPPAACAPLPPTTRSSTPFTAAPSGCGTWPTTRARSGPSRWGATTWPSCGWAISRQRPAPPCRPTWTCLCRPCGRACAGQLPEIYDGGAPGASRGCFAQAWSVGEALRVCEAVERPEAAGFAGSWAED